MTMAWVTPSVYAPGDAEADVAASVLGGGKTSRLYEALVHRTGIAQDVSASQQSLRYGSVFSISATAKPGHTADELEAAIQRELDALAADGPTAAELAAAKTMIRSDDLRAGAPGRGGRPGSTTTTSYLGDPGYLDQDLRRYAEVDAAAVQRFAARAAGPRPARGRAHRARGEGAAAGPAGAAGPGRADGAADARRRPRSPGATPSPSPARPGRPAARPPSASSWTTACRSTWSSRTACRSARRRWCPAGAAPPIPPSSPAWPSFTADMLDEGTPTRDALGIAREIESLGGVARPPRPAATAARSAWRRRPRSWTRR